MEREGGGDSCVGASERVALAWLCPVHEEERYQLSRGAFPNKVGGRPAWMNPLAIPEATELECSKCGLAMTFLLQLYNGDGDEDSAGGCPYFHRSIMLFCCLECTNAFRLFRTQLPRDNPIYPPNELVEDADTGGIIHVSADPARHEFIENELQSHLCQICGVPRRPSTTRRRRQASAKGAINDAQTNGTDTASDGCSGGMYGGSLDDTGRDDTGRDDTGEYDDVGAEANTSKDGHKRCRNFAKHRTLRATFDEFILGDALEVVGGPATVQVQREEHRALNLASDYERRVQQDPDEALDSSECEAFEEIQSETAERLNPGSSKPGGCNGAVDTTGAEILTGAVDDVHRHFVSRAIESSDENSGHVIRYMRGGRPLWHSSKGMLCDAEVPDCELCGSPRVFEAQVMPNLLTTLPGADRMDFGIVAMYTCASSCSTLEPTVSCECQGDGTVATKDAHILQDNDGDDDVVMTPSNGGPHSRNGRHGYEPPSSSSSSCRSTHCRRRRGAYALEFVYRQPDFGNPES